MLFTPEFSQEGEFILGLSLRDFIRPEPRLGAVEESGEQPLYVFNAVQLGRQRIVDVDDNGLPVRLVVVEEGHDPEDFDLLHFASEPDPRSDLAGVDRVVVPPSFGLRIEMGGIFPRLDTGRQHGSVVRTYLHRVVLDFVGERAAYLGQSAIIPDITVEWVYVPHVSEFTIFHILFDRVERLVPRDLY